MEKDRSKLYDYSDGQKFEGKSANEIFSHIAEENMWIEKESVSGFGSSLVQTREIIKELPGILRKFGIKKLLDAPCGDFNWMQKVDLQGIAYTGADIVEKIVEQNQQKFTQEHRKFVRMNIMSDDLGDHDLLFCRDCLVHFSFEDVQKVLKNLKQSGVTFLMTTTFPGQKSNSDIATGGWRPLNLEKAPFNFPPPLYLLNEKCTEMDGAFDDKSLGIWKVADLLE